jgi:hypothetical protein
MSTRFLVKDIPCGDQVANLAQALIGAVRSRVESQGLPGSYWNWYPVEINNNDQVALADFMARHGFPVVPQLSMSGHTAFGHTAFGHTAFGHTALAEVHLARCACATDAPFASGAAAHQDNEGGLLSGKYRTLIAYAKNTAAGGGLAIYDADPITTPVTCTIVDTSPPHDHVRAVLMDGDVWHCPVDLTSEGVRESFVFQLPAF